MHIIRANNLEDAGVTAGTMTKLAADLGTKPTCDIATFHVAEAVRVFGLPRKTRFFAAGQMHSDAIVNCDNYESAAGAVTIIPDCDALISTRKNTALAIRTADCLPVLIADPTKQIIAAVHAGWRGIENEISIKTIEQVIKLDCDPADLLVWVGPSIGSCCFEVQADVAEKFETAIIKRNNKQYVDLHAVLARQLADVGIMQKNTKWADQCTCCEADLFVSHRREGAARTSMNWSIIAQ